MSWKTWKVLEFEDFKFQVWKVLEKHQQIQLVLEKSWNFI